MLLKISVTFDQFNTFFLNKIINFLLDSKWTADLFLPNAQLTINADNLKITSIITKTSV